jgi:hypothetical protein
MNSDILRYSRAFVYSDTLLVLERNRVPVHYRSSSESLYSNSLMVVENVDVGHGQTSNIYCSKSATNEAARRPVCTADNLTAKCEPTV